MAFAALAILGHKSAHSFPIGPVIADPAVRTKDINNTIIGKRLDETINEAPGVKNTSKLIVHVLKITLHFSFGVYNNTSIICKKEQHKDEHHIIIPN